jgi:hypothetical protein
VASAVDVISDLLTRVEAARKLLGKAPNRQVRSDEHRMSLRALALVWFNSVRPAILGTNLEHGAVDGCDTDFRVILDSTDKSAAKSTYDAAMLSAKKRLVELRGQLVTRTGPTVATDGDAAPDFSALAAEPAMRAILERPWEECVRCVGAQAHLAGIVMMGGLLEALFVARANKMMNKAPLFSCAATPMDPRTKKALDLREWTLGPYIDVAEELQWITRSAKDVAAVLRDYRNYVHPEKERRHGVLLAGEDSGMLWQMTKSLARQLLKS